MMISPDVDPKLVFAWQAAHSLARKSPPPVQTLRGGARIDSANATWSFAQLQIIAEHLVLQVKFLGTYTFAPEQVIRVAPFGLIPFFGKGVRISHRVANYPDKIVFWYICADPQPIVDKIAACGYTTA